ncbi:MAG: hypothetical protein E6R03_13440 [Hyphomicrobiaceae bacterium]|nr:MAG: hypothetical protein E6R03_13440 [Hyphomicrobiaceae bacterium]
MQLLNSKLPDTIDAEKVQAMLELIASRPGLLADEIAKELGLSIFDVICVTEMLLSSGVLDFCD